MSTEQQNDRYERGYAALSEVADGAQDAVLDGLADIAPHMGRYIVEFGFGDIYTRPGLTRRQRQLSTVAALAAMGNAAPQLRFHIGGALNVGCTRQEIVEVLIHVCVYAGFPAALNGLTAAREVFESRPDEPPFVPATDAPGGDRYARGQQALADIDGHAGQQVIDSLKDIAPDLARYVLEFSFGDIYSRTGLDLPTRELVTVALCTALGTVGPQLRVHLHGLLNVGGTREEAVEVITQMAGYAGFPAALNGLAAAREVFAARDAT
ncbi:MULTISPECIES: carboxymuconolactone decarboxylase family protein [unclassified Streptomyces]|uniref:carboxymuconolactone decarboxylase family protein n=1 Tax=unclassified Streptomyces TaxID=2593676 RepID=UPI000378AF62|nr:MULTISPECIES: carboxymuconolactone decarboxylase family protein [unclassified Streptomyces]MYQ78372.1 carboxymuconolactone decarboxylase [Streptomyces sp. SID4923]